MKKRRQYFKSKTIIFNMLVAVFTAVELNYEFIKEHNENYYMYIVLAVTAINFILRTVTTKPLSEK